MKLGITWGEELGREECPYLRRWILNGGKLGSLRLYHWISSDDKRAKHDHSADFITLILKGSYIDVSAYAHEYMRPGKVRRRKAEHTHFVDVMPNGCWTLLYFFPDRRRWGFWVQRADKSWKWVKSNKYFLTYGHHPCD